MRRFRTNKRNPIIALAWIAFLIAYLIFLFSNQERVGLRILSDMVIFFLSLFITTALYSQMIFPLYTIQDRFYALRQFLLFILHRHGPAIRVQDGELKITHNKYHSNFGIIQLDSASAAVLRIPSRYNRTVGPGVIFLEKDESIESTIDLHIQKKLIGPRINENPYLPKQKFETTSDYKSRQERADTARAYTQDGVEITPTFIIYFKIKSEPNTGNTPFGYDPLSIQKAVIVQKTESATPLHNSQQAHNWQSIVINQTIKVWRENINKIRFIQLFDEKGDGLEKIVQRVTDNIIVKESPQKVLSGNLAGKSIQSPEYTELLQKGIEVIHIALIQLLFAPKVENELAENWITLQKHPARNLISLKDSILNDAHKQGQIEAHTEFSKRISESLQIQNNLLSNDLLDNLMSTSIQILEYQTPISQKFQMIIEKLKVAKDLWSK